MKQTTITAALFAATLNTSYSHADNSEVTHFIIAPDISSSASLLTNDEFAKAAINRVKQKILTLKKGAWVEIKTFGDGSFAHTGRRKTRISSKSSTPDYVANLVETTLHEIRAEAGQGQSSTNMLAYLELSQLHCDSGASHVYLLTDAIEHSVDVSGEALLNGTQSLPTPDEGLLSGCSFTIIGLGNVAGGLLPRAQRRNLEKAWRGWFTDAGANSVNIIYRP